MLKVEEIDPNTIDRVVELVKARRTVDAIGLLVEDYGVPAHYAKKLIDEVWLRYNEQEKSE